MAEHTFSWEPQPIADQIMARCSCGWRKPVSLYEYRTAEAAHDRAQELFAEHMNEMDPRDAD